MGSELGLRYEWFSNNPNKLSFCANSLRNRIRKELGPIFIDEIRILIREEVRD